MSSAFKTGLIAGAIGAVVFAIINVALGGRSIQGIFGASLIAFAVVLFVAYIIARIVGGRQSKEEEEEYGYDDY